MEVAETAGGAPARAGRQLTVDEKIDLLVLIAHHSVDGKLPVGGRQKIQEAKNISITAILKYAKRLQAGKPAHEIVK